MERREIGEVLARNCPRLGLQCLVESAGCIKDHLHDECEPIRIHREGIAARHRHVKNNSLNSGKACEDRRVLLSGQRPYVVFGR